MADRNVNKRILLTKSKHQTFSSILSLPALGTKESTVKCLLDSGAEISLIKISVLDNNNSMTNNETEITGISGTVVKTLGTITLYFLTNDGREFPGYFHVVDDDFPILQDGIIGENFLNEYHAVINYGSKSVNLHVGNKTMEFPFEIDKKDVVIPARTERIIRYGPVGQKEDCLATLDSENLGLFLSNTLVKPTNGHVYLSLINITENPIILNDNFKINLSPLENFNIYHFNKVRYENPVESRLKKLEELI